MKQDLMLLAIEFIILGVAVLAISFAHAATKSQIPDVGALLVPPKTDPNIPLFIDPPNEQKPLEKPKKRFNRKFGWLHHDKKDSDSKNQ